MLDRMQVGEVAKKHHIQLRGTDGELRFEECFTRDGFDGPYTIMYHLRRPHTQRIAPAAHGWAAPVAVTERPLAKRHYKTGDLAKQGSGAQVDARIPLVFNADVTCGVAFPTAEDPVYVVNGDAD
ncbi:MAG TPA: homogentisate 1,2-dioxygenase, partial [Kofleriaceae bacterium]|nr:homogentisate 1,2-dioxygenase [Kofleriaceae bacterium]